MTEHLAVVALSVALAAAIWRWFRWKLEARFWEEKYWLRLGVARLERQRQRADAIARATKTGGSTP